MIFRLSLLLITVAAALAVAPAAWAGSQVFPEDDALLSTAAPEFRVELTADDLDARVDVTTEDGVPVGSCTPAPVTCTLAAPLANGAYLWTLRVNNRFCDGYAGELCGLVERTAGPRRFEIAVPRAEPSQIVLGRSIGAARLGAKRDELYELYGDPDRVRGATASWTVEGGLLEVVFDDDVAVSVSTTSAYYRTAGGVGVGRRAPSGWTPVASGLARGTTRLTLAGRRVVRVTIATPAALRAAAGPASTPRR